MRSSYSKEKTKIYNSLYYKENAEKLKAYQKEYRKENLEKIKKDKIEYRKKNSRIIKNNFLINKFKLSIDDYDKELEKQNNCCAICGKHQNEYKRKFAVDHCHSTGKIRGLLCSKCNTGIGQFNDNVDILNKAITYLNNNKL